MIPSDTEARIWKVDGDGVDLPEAVLGMNESRPVRLIGKPLLIVMSLSERKGPGAGISYPCVGRGRV